MPRRSYLSSTAPASRHITNDGTNSSVNPDEDWAKISNTVERRRVQNRIAQRKYRKKLQTRVKELERRVESSSSASTLTPAELPHASRLAGSRQHCKRSPDYRQPQPSPILLLSQSTLPVQSDNEGIFTNGFEKDGSGTLPLFSCSTIPASEDVMYPLYAQQLYKPILSSGDWKGADTDYHTTVPIIVPSTMQYYNSVTSEYEDTMAPFDMTDQELPAVNDRQQHDYNDSNSQLGSTRAPPHWPNSPKLGAPLHLLRDDEQVDHVSTHREECISLIRTLDELLEVCVPVPDSADIDACQATTHDSDMTGRQGVRGGGKEILFGGLSARDVAMKEGRGEAEDLPLPDMLTIHSWYPGSKKPSGKESTLP